MISNCAAALSQNDSGNNSHEKESYNLDEDVACGVHTGEAVPVPVRNVGCYCAENSSDKDETDAAGKAANARRGPKGIPPELIQAVRCRIRFQAICQARMGDRAA